MRRAVSARSIVCATSSGGTPRRAVSSSALPIAAGTLPYSAWSSGGMTHALPSARALSQIGVATDPGSSSATWTLELRSSTRSASPIASIACLEAAYGASERHRHASADRGNEHDPPVRAAQRRQQRLRDGHLREHVDIELPAQVLVRDQLERAADADAGVVDERVEATARRRSRSGAHLLYPLDRLRDLQWDRHLERQRDHACPASARPRRRAARPPPGRARPPAPSSPWPPGAARSRGRFRSMRR